MKKILIKTSIMIAVIAAALILIPRSENVKAASGKGTVYVENIDVTGMSEDEIEQVIADKLARYSSDIITLNAFGESITVTAGELGLYNSDETLAYRAANTTSRGNLFERFLTKKYVEESGAVFYQLNLRVDEDAVRETLSQIAAELERDPVNMTAVKLSDGSFAAVGELTEGRYVELEESVSALCEYLNNDWHGGEGEMNLLTYTVSAQGSAEDIAKIDSLLGSKTTSYSTGGDSVNRAGNIFRGAELINGTVLYPGEEFSASKALEPFTEENGYYLAPTFETGSVVDDYGGGACQIASTLYNAVLYAELEVTKRSSHSMIVTYVEPALDAAVASGIKDLRFVNNTDAPIYIEAYTTDDGGTGTITFNIYGHGTRDPSREIVLESETLSTTETTTATYGLSSSIEVGEVKAVGSYPDVTAVSYKYVYENGELVSQTVLNQDHYTPSSASYMIGIDGATAEQIEVLSEYANKEKFNEVYALLQKWKDEGIIKDDTADGAEDDT